MSKMMFILGGVVVLAALTLVWRGRHVELRLPFKAATSHRQAGDSGPQRHGQQRHGQSADCRSPASRGQSSQQRVERGGGPIDRRHDGPAADHLEVAHLPLMRSRPQPPSPLQALQLRAAVSRRFRKVTVSPALAELPPPSSPPPDDSDGVVRLPPPILLGPGEQFDQLPDLHMPPNVHMPPNGRMPTNTTGYPAIGNPVTGDSPAGEGDVVLFAAGAVELRPPAGWSVTEMPYGREVRLVVSPVAPKLPRQMPNDGMWLAYHPRSVTETVPLADMIESRLALASDNAAQTVQSSPTKVAGWEAIKIEFTTTPDSSGEEEPSDRQQGYHLLVQTDWGVLELHVVSPSTLWSQRLAQFDGVLAELTLGPPTVGRREVLASVRDAEPILGSWRAYRSLLKLTGDGRIVIVIDPPTTRPLDAAPPRSSDERRRRLTGNYQAQHDLLLVEWDDGSKLNYRWRIRQGELLMTDHQGRISQLRPVLQ